MTTRHLTEEEIQEYALDPGGNEEYAEHVRSCEWCMSQVSEYALLFSGIREQGQPSFDFDLSELVVQRLPPVKQRVTVNWAVYLVLFVGAVPIGAGLYMFRDYVYSLFSGVAAFVLYLIITTVMTILIVLCIDMYKSFQKKIHALDVY